METQQLSKSPQQPPIVTHDPLPTLISVAAADELIRAAVALSPVERTPLSEAANRVLREPVLADRDMPPFDRVAMDGIALSAAAWQNGLRRFRIEGVSPAGSPRSRLLDENGCIRVMTGAVMPVGADLVIPVEELVMNGAGWAEAAELAAPAPHVHRQGSDRNKGALLVPPGVRLAERHLGILASVGESAPLVSRNPRVAVVPTGDELVAVDATPLPHQIRGSNDLAVSAAIARWGYAPERVVPLRDDVALLRRELAQLLDNHDAVVITGGVSAGDFDFIPSVLQELGVSPLFHKILQRPGKPLWVGVRSGPSPTIVFGLPGNPVSALIGTIRYIIPYLRRCAGDTGVEEVERARLAGEYVFDPGLTCFLPVVLSFADDGCLLADPAPTNGSGDYAALADADGFLELPAEQTKFEPGFVARLYRFGATE